MGEQHCSSEGGQRTPRTRLCRGPILRLPFLRIGEGEILGVKGVFARKMAIRIEERAQTRSVLGEDSI